MHSFNHSLRPAAIRPLAQDATGPIADSWRRSWLLPIAGIWMLPIGLALLADEVQLLGSFHPALWIGSNTDHIGWPVFPTHDQS